MHLARKNLIDIKELNIGEGVAGYGHGKENSRQRYRCGNVICSRVSSQTCRFNKVMISDLEGQIGRYHI